MDCNLNDAEVVEDLPGLYKGLPARLGAEARVLWQRDALLKRCSSTFRCRC